MVSRDDRAVLGANTAPVLSGGRFVFRGHLDGRVTVCDRVGDRNEVDIVPRAVFEWWQDRAEARDLAREILLRMFARGSFTPLRYEAAVADRLMRLGSSFVLYEEEVRRWITAEQRAYTMGGGDGLA